LLKRTVSGIMFLLLLIAMLTLAFNIQPVKAEPIMITVPDDYPTIQEAINHAGSGDTVYVRVGIYYENVVVNKTVTLIGEDKSSTIIDGNGTGTVVTITANSVNISVFTIRNGYGIEVLYSSGHIITGNMVSNNEYGIRLRSSHSNKICNNLIASNTLTGIELRESSGNVIINNTIIKNGFNIWLWKSDDNDIIGNTASNGDWGIILYRSSNNTLRDNMMTGNRYNFGVWGEYIADFIHDIDASNLINEKPIYYLINERNLTIDSSTFPDVGYLGIVNSANILVKDLTLTENSEGVLLVHVTGSILENVHASLNSGGIKLKCGSCYNTLRNNVITTCEMVGISLLDSSNNNITGNKITSILNTGISLLRSNDNIISRNHVERAREGLYIVEYSNNNLIYHNNLIDNTKQVYLSFYGINAWDNGYPSGGNYWSDYAGVDSDGDGIGDTSYVIDANNQDRYPLMNPWGTGTPVASFAWTPLISKVGESVTFDASASTPNGGEIVSYEWNFGDSHYGSGKIVTHTYTSSAIYTVTLNVTDSEGLWDTEQKQIQVVQPHGSKAEFTAVPDTASTGESIKFDASSSLSGFNGTHEMPITEYSWNFGDGNQTTTSTPTVYHSFGSSGIYYVTLTVDSPGATPETDSTTHKVTIISVPVGGYSFPIKGYTTTEPLTLYIVLVAILTVSFTMVKRRKKQQN